MDVPLAIAETAAEIASLAAPKPGLEGDAEAAARLAAVAADVVARLVQLNLEAAGRPDDPRSRQAADAAGRAARSQGTSSAWGRAGWDREAGSRISDRHEPPVLRFGARR